MPNKDNKCAGHALLPYAYSPDGASTDVYVYDSNHPYNPDDPGESTGLKITITPSTNSWSYNHSNSLDTWQSGQTCRRGLLTAPSSLRVIPLSAYRDRPTPPWPGGGMLRPGVQASATAGRYEVTVSRNGSLTIQDNQGRVVGNRNGELVLEIPGSYLDIPVGVIPGADFEYPERYVISTTAALTISLTYSETGETFLYGIVPGGMVAVLGASASAAAVDTIQVAPDASEVNVRAGSSGQGREMTLLREGSTHGRQVSIGDFGLTSANIARLILSSNTDAVTFTTSEPQQNGYQIQLEQAGATSTEFLATAPSMQGGDVHVIRLDWNNPVTASVAIDRGGDGSVDEIVVLVNEAKQLYLPIILKGTGGG